MLAAMREFLRCWVDGGIRHIHYTVGYFTLGAMTWEGACVRAMYSSRRTRRSTLPTRLLGRESRNSYCFGTLYGARRSLRNAFNSSSVSVTPGLTTTNARTVSPRYSSGTP